MVSRNGNPLITIWDTTGAAGHNSVLRADGERHSGLLSSLLRKANCHTQYACHEFHQQSSSRESLGVYRRRATCSRTLPIMCGTLPKMAAGHLSDQASPHGRPNPWRNGFCLPPKWTLCSCTYRRRGTCSRPRRCRRSRLSSRGGHKRLQTRNARGGVGSASCDGTVVQRHACGHYQCAATRLDRICTTQAYSSTDHKAHQRCEQIHSRGYPHLAHNDGSQYRNHTASRQDCNIGGSPGHGRQQGTRVRHRALPRLRLNRQASCQQTRKRHRG